MTTTLSIRKVKPWKGSQGPAKDFSTYVQSEDLIPPSTPNRKRILYDSSTPDWRWTEADKIYQSISNPSEYQPGRDADPLIVKDILPFIWHLQTSTSTLVSEQNTRDKFPDLWWAHRLMKKQGVSPLFIQAGAIAGVPVEAIAQEMCAYPEQIWWYEKMFYDVRAFVDNPRWVALNVFHPALQRIGPLHVEDFLWKIIAWNPDLGWEDFLTIINPMDKLSTNARARIIDMLDRKILTDTLLAVFSRTPNRFNENFIVDQYLKILEIEKDQGPGGGDQQKDNNLLGLMQSIQSSFHMASIDTTFDGVEPRAHTELVSVFNKRRQLAAEAESQNPGGDK